MSAKHTITHDKQLSGGRHRIRCSCGWHVLGGQNYAQKCFEGHVKHQAAWAEYDAEQAAIKKAAES